MEFWRCGVNRGLEFVHKSMLAYGAACRPLCQKLKLTQTAFDILMFLANNPCYKTASEIVEIRHIKANLVSVNVDRLVREGYLLRQPVKGDRRKTELICTALAQPVIEQGRTVQDNFMKDLLRGMDEATQAAFFSAITIIDRNMDELLKEMK